MRPTTDVFQRLDRDWAHDGAGPPARAALARWTTPHPALGQLASPAELVARCRQRDPQATSELLAAVLAEADHDPWARRTVLQALVPALAAMSYRARACCAGRNRIWSSRDELDQFIVATAYQRIAALAGHNPARPYPARVVMDSVWRRVRHQVAIARREASRTASLELAQATSAPPERSPVEQLVANLADAVQRRVVEPADAGVLYACSAGYRIEELAHLGPGRSLRRRRERAARLLRADPGAECDPVSLLLTAGARGA